MKPLLVSSGEPAGIGPDLCLELANALLPVVILGDPDLLSTRARLLGLNIVIEKYNASTYTPQKGVLAVLPVACAEKVLPGILNPSNVPYVLDMLQIGIASCLNHSFSGLVTAPVHKAIINEAGVAFTGHTEFLAEYCQVERVVMMLVCDQMRVALATTHLPLRKVADAIQEKSLIKTLQILNQALKLDFGIDTPTIYVAGLNPHAGEGGCLGDEEINIISPALDILRQAGLDVQGPFSADTMFTQANAQSCDAFLAMYHDQGLPVLKYAGFGQAVNVTLGLPIIRTSVDHGTALTLAGKGTAKAGSLYAAVALAFQMALNRGAP